MEMGFLSYINRIVLTSVLSELALHLGFFIS